MSSRLHSHLEFQWEKNLRPSSHRVLAEFSFLKLYYLCWLLSSYQFAFGKHFVVWKCFSILKLTTNMLLLSSAKDSATQTVVQTKIPKWKSPWFLNSTASPMSSTSKINPESNNYFAVHSHLHCPWHRHLWPSDGNAVLTALTSPPQTPSPLISQGVVWIWWN